MVSKRVFEQLDQQRRRLNPLYPQVDRLAMKSQRRLDEGLVVSYRTGLLHGLENAARAEGSSA